MEKVPVLIANDTVADGKGRRGGKIYLMAEDTLHLLHSRGTGRRATDAEVAALGIEPEPELEPGSARITKLAAAPGREPAADDTY